LILGAIIAFIVYNLLGLLYYCCRIVFKKEIKYEIRDIAIWAISSGFVLALSQLLTSLNLGNSTISHVLGLLLPFTPIVIFTIFYIFVT
jgi:hypothetical protein